MDAEYLHGKVAPAGKLRKRILDVYRYVWDGKRGYAKHVVKKEFGREDGVAKEGTLELQLGDFLPEASYKELSEEVREGVRFNKIITSIPFDKLARILQIA